MSSIKAILAGTLFIIVVVLFLQLAYIFVAVAYNALAKDYPLLNDIVGYFRYFIGIPLFLLTVFMGGYITASVAKAQSGIKTVLHGIVLGLIVAAATLYPTLENANITTTGLVIVALALLATTSAGLYWKKTSTTG